MSIYDKSSLVLIPSGTKTGKVFSQKPVSGDGDFTFTRSSAATRVNADGNIEKETQNLLLYSNQPNQWSVVSVSLTGGQAGYDGSNDAWLFDSSAGYIRNNLSLSGVYTYSIYAKQGTANGIRLRMDAGTDANVYINLTDGSESFSPSGIDYTATSVGGGWWRISVTQNDSSFSNFRVYAIDASGGSTTGTIYIQDAQINQGLVAQPYQETIASAVYGGITDNTPRLDYTDSSCPALLLEPQRTNAMPHSEYINAGGGYTITGASVTYNSSTSPDGYTNAALFDIPYNNAGFYNFATGGSKSVGDKLTLSVFAKLKSGSATNVLAIGYGGVAVGGDRLSEFNLSTGTISYSHPNADSVSIEDYGNGWYRLIQTQTCTAAGSAGLVVYGRGEMDVYIWGVQSEDASYATSYIPTYGSSVTRNEETTYVTSATDIIGQTEGTMFVEYDQNLIGQLATRRIMALTDGGIINRIVVYVSSTNKIDFYVRNSSGNLFLGTSVNVNTKGMHKIAAAYKDGDYVVYLDGTQIISGAGTAGTIPACNRIDLGNQIGVNDLFEPIHQAMLFKTRLSNEELADLTTI